MALISFAVTAKLICVFVFPYAKSRFSHDAAHLYFMVMNLKGTYIHLRLTGNLIRFDGKWDFCDNKYFAIRGEANGCLFLSFFLDIHRPH